MFGSGYGFGVGGSNGAVAVCCSIKSKMAANGHVGYTKMELVILQLFLGYRGPSGMLPSP